MAITGCFLQGYGYNWMFTSKIAKLDDDRAMAITGCFFL